MKYIIIDNVEHRMRGEVEIASRDDGDTEYKMLDVIVTVFLGGSVGLKVGKKSLMLDGTQAERLFALLHTANIDQGSHLLGEPAIYELKKDTGVPF